MEKNAPQNLVHSYYKSALAVAFNPQMEPRSALRTLNLWIAKYPGLTDRLTAAGYTKSAKILTPAQVQLIFDALGEP